MEQAWRGLLAQYGQPVTLHSGEYETEVRAFVQPLLEGKSQQLPAPLGLERQDRFRYLGPADCHLDLDTLVKWKGTIYRVCSAHLVGEGVCPHWRAVLAPREESAL